MTCVLQLFWYRCISILEKPLKGIIEIGFPAAIHIIVFNYHGHIDAFFVRVEVLSLNLIIWALFCYFFVFLYNCLQLTRHNVSTIVFNGHFVLIFCIFNFARVTYQERKLNCRAKFTSCTTCSLVFYNAVCQQTLWPTVLVLATSRITCRTSC